MNRRGALSFLTRLATLFGFSNLQTHAGANEPFDGLGAMHMHDGFPYPVLTVPGYDAQNVWKRLREQENGWPIIVGDDEALELIVEQYSANEPAATSAEPGTGSAFDQSLEGIVAAAQRINVAAKLQELFNSEFGDDPLEIEKGVWPGPKELPPVTITVDKDILTGAPHKRVHIVIVPTNEPAHVPAYLRWGDWNACPGPEVHVAVHQKWHAQFGAEIVGIDGATINMRVARRPASRAQAMELAREQFLYCPDIVLQGTDSLEALAMSLMESDIWYFWWD